MKLFTKYKIERKRKALLKYRMDKLTNKELLQEGK